MGFFLSEGGPTSGADAVGGDELATVSDHGVARRMIVGVSAEGIEEAVRSDGREVL